MRFTCERAQNDTFHLLSSLSCSSPLRRLYWKKWDMERLSIIACVINYHCYDSIVDSGFAFRSTFSSVMALGLKLFIFNSNRRQAGWNKSFRKVSSFHGGYLLVYDVLCSLYISLQLFLYLRQGCWDTTTECHVWRYSRWSGHRGTPGVVLTGSMSWAFFGSTATVVPSWQALRCLWSMKGPLKGLYLIWSRTHSPPSPYGQSVRPRNWLIKSLWRLHSRQEWQSLMKCVKANQWTLKENKNREKKINSIQFRANSHFW